MNDELRRALERVISEANIALDEGTIGAGTDDADTMRRVLDRVHKAKCLCEAALAKFLREATNHA